MQQEQGSPSLVIARFRGKLANPRAWGRLVILLASAEGHHLRFCSYLPLLGRQIRGRY